MKNIIEQPTFKFFKLDEFRCPCGCGLLNISHQLVGILDDLRRTDYPFKLPINSGSRCVSHNKKVGGKENSSHLFGLAADPQILGAAKRYRFVKAAIARGIRQIGIYKTFIHVGLDPDKPFKLFRGDK